jgi:hypothetical protein
MLVEAEFPTCQYKPAAAAVLITLTTDPGEVNSVPGIWKTQKTFKLPLQIECYCAGQIARPGGYRVDAWNQCESR